MSTLVFQVVIKQWDKSQRSDADVASRDSVANAYPIQAKPEFLIFDHPCIIDQHSINFATEQSNRLNNRPLKKALLADGIIELERFIISKPANNQSLLLEYRNKDKEIIKVANSSLDKGWIQAKYNWRYRVEKLDEIFWQYEELTLNMALVTKLEEEYFIRTHVGEPHYYEDND
jgi:hypothetical protein